MFHTDTSVVTDADLNLLLSTDFFHRMSNLSSQTRN